MEKKHLYISVGCALILFLFIHWIINCCDGGDWVWKKKGHDNVSSILSIPVVGDYMKAWIITKNDFTDDGRYIYGEMRGNFPSHLPSQHKRGDSKGEVECRRVLESIFNAPFNKIRPKFLNNSVTSSNLEIDCYNDDLKIGVEYNGVQHYKYTPYFHKNEEAFMNQKYRDEMKRRLCKDNDILLIEVPHTVAIEDIQQYIIEELKDNGKI